MTDEEVNAKFCSLAQRVLPPGQIGPALFDTATDMSAIFEAVRSGGYLKMSKVLFCSSPVAIFNSP